mmetsp:Transcript_24922/g.57815  ORF Transcript_24922/g.57815 Transcript_24922/m.57815 type:complete len:313 (-) Transcript_24922:377-1315(-)
MAASVEVNGIVALAELGHHQVHEVDVPAGGKGDDEPFQQGLFSIGNVFIVLTPIDVQGHGEHGFEGGRPTVETLHLDGIFGTLLRQANHGGGKGGSKECEHAHVEDELPPEASTYDTEHGKLDIEMHELRSQHEIEQHWETRQSVVGLTHVAIPGAVFTTIRNPLVTNLETVQDRLHAEHGEKKDQQHDFNELLTRLHQVAWHAETPNQGLCLLAADGSEDLGGVLDQQLAHAADIHKDAACDHHKPRRTLQVIRDHAMLQSDRKGHQRQAEPKLREAPGQATQPCPEQICHEDCGRVANNRWICMLDEIQK